MNEYDVVIVGGGAAGLSAALVLARARRSVVVIDAGRPRNAPAAHMHGFLASDGLPPAALLAAGRQEVSGYGASVVPGTVIDVARPAAIPAPETLSFVVTLDTGQVLTARRVLVSTGLTDEVPDIPGLRERWGRDVLHCPYCHGYEVRDEPVGVIGGSDEAVAHAHLVRQWSDDLIYFTNGTTPTAEQVERFAARGIRLVDGEIARLVITADRLSGVELAGGRVVPRTAVFVRPRFVPNAGLLSTLGCTTDANGWVVTDPTGRTSAPGIWAAGNAVNPRAQVITAAGEGSAAAIAINNDLVEEDVTLAVAQARSRDRG
jgi:thioredoxin reductase